MHSPYLPLPSKTATKKTAIQARLYQDEIESGLGLAIN